MRKGTIIRIVSNQYQVRIDDEIVSALAMGKLRKGVSPVVGDIVEVELMDDKWGIQKILPRKNELIRPKVANVDQALIVMSAKEPDFSTTLVDRLIFLVSVANIKPILVISKADLVSKEKITEIVNEYEPYGYKVMVSGKEFSLDDFPELFEGKISVLAGQSGVGKSTLLNRINPGFDLDTQAISKALGRGKHTTRHNQLYPVYGGWVADTPGFSSLDFSVINKEDLAQSVPEFKPYIGECKYRNCLHDKEPSCTIKEKVEIGEISKERYQHYIECLHLAKGGSI